MIALAPMVDAPVPTGKPSLVAKAMADTDNRCVRLAIDFSVPATITAAPATTVEAGPSVIGLSLTAPTNQPISEDVGLPEAAKPLVAEARLTAAGESGQMTIQAARDAAVSATLVGSRLLVTVCRSPAAAAPAITRAERAIIAGDLKLAAALLLEAAGSDPPARPRALELTGVIEERLGRADTARATYQDYLARFGSTPDADRVRQRLTALSPVQRHGVAMSAAPAIPRQGSASLHGSFAQFYLRDRSRSVFQDSSRPLVGEQIDVRDNVDELLSTLDIDAKAVTPGWTLTARFDGGHVSEYRPVTLVGGDRGKGSYSLLSEANVSAQRDGDGLRVDVGRQWRLGSGVLGRFDGAAVRVPVSSKDDIEAIAGFPVWSPRQLSVDTGKWFYGFALSRHGLAHGLDAKLYWFDQYAAGRSDRRAIGAEAQVVGKRFSGSLLVDLDLGFGTISSFVLRAETRPSAANTLALEIERLHFPTLALDNAAIGQPTPSFAVVAATLPPTDIRNLARDRTMRLDAATLTWSHFFGSWGELVTDATLSRTTASPASGGVPGFPGSGLEIYGGTQLIATGLAGRGSTLSFALRGADVEKARIISVEAVASLRAPLGLRLSPQLRFAHRVNKGATGWQDVLQPAVRVLRPLGSTAEIELQAGGNLLWQHYAGADLQGTRREQAFIAHIGYRIRF